MHAVPDMLGPSAGQQVRRREILVARLWKVGPMTMRSEHRVRGGCRVHAGVGVPCRRRSVVSSKYHSAMDGVLLLGTWPKELSCEQESLWAGAAAHRRASGVGIQLASHLSLFRCKRQRADARAKDKCESIIQEGGS